MERISNSLKVTQQLVECPRQDPGITWWNLLWDPAGLISLTVEGEQGSRGDLPASLALSLAWPPETTPQDPGVALLL